MSPQRQFQSFTTTAESSLSHTNHKQLSGATIYDEPENFLEVEVCNPKTHFPSGDSKGMYTDYEINAGPTFLDFLRDKVLSEEDTATSSCSGNY